MIGSIIEGVGIDEPISPQFSEIVNKDIAATNWLNAIALLPKSIDEQKLKSALIACVFNRQAFSESDLEGGRVDLNEMDHISYITERTIPVFTLSFAREDRYRKFMTKLGYESIPQGVSIPLNFATLLTELGITQFEEPLRSMHIIVYCEQQLPNMMPPEQIVRHESLHAIDPLLEFRRGKDTLILTEMIATIGEFASETDDVFVLNSYPSFWMEYLKRIQFFTPEFFQVFSIRKGASFQDAANSIVTFVKEITLRRRNSEIVRMLMDCTSFAELEGKLKRFLPNRKGMAAEILPTAIEPEIEAVLKRRLSAVMYYYNNWPDAYNFNKRSISSLWQQSSYGDQAMNTFLDGNLHNGMTTLLMFANRYGFLFDTSNISRFNVVRQRDGMNHRITISW